MAKYYKSHGSPIPDLLDFLKEARRLLRAIVEARDLLFPNYRRDIFQQAWDEIERNWDSLVGNMRRQSDEAFEAHGMSGPQLELKLDGFWLAQKRFDRFASRRLLKKLLEWINRILSSLTWVPGVEPFKEIKDAIEAELDLG